VGSVVGVIEASTRSPWRAVVVPSEHGGFALTLEPALLGLVVAPSIAGDALAIAAFLAFLVRTPLKVLLVDRRRGRALERDRLARRVAAVELTALAVMVAVALARAGLEWVVPFAIALPLFGVELWYDARSRGRRLVPELCGAIGISAVVASIALAGGEGSGLAIAMWLVLAGRAAASVPFARVQVQRLRSAPPPTTISDLSQLAGVVLAAAAVAVDDAVLAGAAAAVVVAIAQFAWSRGPARPALAVGLSQLGFGLLVVAATAIGVLAGAA
jgi:hypothetical protein